MHKLLLVISFSLGAQQFHLNEQELNDAIQKDIQSNIAINKVRNTVLLGALGMLTGYLTTPFVVLIGEKITSSSDYEPLFALTFILQPIIGATIGYNLKSNNIVTDEKLQTINRKHNASYAPTILQQADASLSNARWYTIGTTEGVFINDAGRDPYIEQHQKLSQQCYLLSNQYALLESMLKQAESQEEFEPLKKTISEKMREIQMLRDNLRSKMYAITQRPDWQQRLDNEVRRVYLKSRLQ